MTPNECISIAAARIGDAGFVNITREEYLTFLNDTAHEIWFRSKAAHVVRQYELPEDEKSFAIPDNDVIRFGLIQYRFGEEVGLSDYMNLHDPEQRPIHLQEKPAQQDIEEGYGYFHNRGALQEDYHITLDFNNGTHVLRSNRKFGKGMLLHAYCIIHSPHYSWVVVPDSENPAWGQTPTDQEVRDAVASGALDAGTSQLIWEPFRNTFISGVVWRAAEQHMRYVKDRSVQEIYKNHMGLFYKMYLPRTIHYIHTLKDDTSMMRMRPFHYLMGNKRMRLY
jgi:hypothetical protein